MSYCPLIHEKCKEKECVFWLIEAPSDEKKCALYWAGLSFMPVHEERIQRIEESAERELIGEREMSKKALLEIKTKSIDGLSKDLMAFMKKEYPDALLERRLPDELLELFWANKGIPPSMFYQNYELELIKTQVEAKAILNLRKELPAARVPEFHGISVAPEIEEHAITEEGLKEIKTKTVEELAAELVEYAKKVYPEIIERVSSVPYDVKKLFWTEKGIAGYIPDPQLSLKKSRVEAVADIKWKEKAIEEISPEFKEKTAEELGEELAVYLRKSPPDCLFDNRRLRIITEQFWTEKYPSLVRIWDPSIRLKKERTESLANQELEKDRRKYLTSLIEKLIEWSKKKAREKITRSDVKMFLMESGVKLSSTAHDILYREAKLKFER